MRRQTGWALIAIFLVLSTTCLLLAGSQNEIQSYVGGMLSLPLGIIPLWGHFLLAGTLLAWLWWSLRGRSRELQFGVCFLTAGWIIGLLWLALGVAQEALPRWIVTVTTSLEFQPTLDDRRLRLECSFMPFAETGVGATATFHNPGAQSVDYTVGQFAFRRYWNYSNYMNWVTSEQRTKGEFISLSLAPDETKRISWPLNPSMFGALVYVESHLGLRQPDGLSSRPLVAFCSMFSGSRNGLFALGALCALAGLVSLGVGFFRGHLGASSTNRPKYPAAPAGPDT